MICITCYELMTDTRYQGSSQHHHEHTNGRRALILSRHALAFLLPRTLVHYLSRLPILMPSHGDSNTRS